MEKLKRVRTEIIVSGIFIILSIIRIINNKDDMWWIWIVNYLSLWVVVSDMFIKQIKVLKNKEHCGTFIGFSIVIELILLGVMIWLVCKKAYPANWVNDVITLLALMFSLAQELWMKLLNLFVLFLKNRGF